MMSIRRVLARVRAIVRGHESAGADLRAEMEAHLELEIERFVRRGMSPDEARRQAMIASGGLAQAAEAVHETRGVPWIESALADIRHAGRRFRRTPVSTSAMILVLSLGIGSTVVLFTVLNSIATMPAPGMVRDASVVRIRGAMRLDGMTDLQARLLSWPEVQEYAGRGDVFSSVTAYAEESGVVDLGGAGSAPVTLSLIYATSNYFDVLDVRPVLGTGPPAQPDDTRLTATPTVVISHAMWQQWFGGARDVLGRTVRVNDVPIQIAGVAPPRFAGADGHSGMTIWLPLAAYPLFQKRTSAVFASRDSLFLRAAARLQPDVTTRVATPIVDGIAQRAFDEGGRASATRAAGSDVTTVTGRADVVPMLASNGRVSNRTDLLISGAASAGFALLVLLITCSNVSALLVGASVARRREIGVRLSLGAPRTRLIRQLLTESVLLALIAAAVGLVVTTAGISVVDTALPDVQLVVNWRVTVATCGVAVVTGILLGISPALHATRVSVGEVLKGSSSAVAATRSRLQRALVIAQIALTQPLLVGLGVVIATMAGDVTRSGTSSVADRLAEIELDPWAGRVSPEELGARIAAIVDRVAAMPGVTAAMPMQSGTITAPLTAHPADRIAGIAYESSMEATLTAAPPGYFEAFEIPIVIGRDFDPGEYANASRDPLQPVTTGAVIIGSDLARRLWGDANPVGRRLAMALSEAALSRPMTVVGVVDETAAGPSEINGQVRVYVPHVPMSTGVIARTAGPALPMLNAMRALVAAEAPQVPIDRVETMAQREARSRRDVVRAAGMAAGGGVLALLLSAIGLYAVVSLGVAQRTREIGIRTALGAPRGQVVRMFFANGLASSAIGLLLGLPLSMLVIRFIDARLDWPLATSPLLGVAIGGLVLVVASVAVWIPARRASRIQPVLAMRAE